MSPEEADRYAGASAAYVHIPFCARVCPYCDFAVVAGRDDLIDRYVDAVVAEISRAEPWRPLESVYLGGGTPSHVDPRSLGRILDALAGRHGIASGAEISLEVNPEDFSVEKAEWLRRVGFNRVSFGVQSLDGPVLVALGRRHDPDAGLAVVERARAAGFENVSVDLIYGTPGETDDSWERSVAALIETGVRHASCYALTVEPGTPLGRAVARGAESPDPDVQADRWEHADAALTAAGLGRYEVSNWAAPGQECRYNLTVWAEGEYEAYGMGAHGHRHGVRWRNYRRLDTYLDAVESGRPPRAAHEPMTWWEAEIDRLFVGLRRSVGVAHGLGTAAFRADPEGARLIDASVVSYEAERLLVLRPLLTDQVCRVVLGLDERWEERAGADNVSG